MKESITNVSGKALLPVGKSPLVCGLRSLLLASFLSPSEKQSPENPLPLQNHQFMLFIAIGVVPTEDSSLPNSISSTRKILSKFQK